MTNEEIRIAVAEECGMKWYVAHKPPNNRRFLSWPDVAELTDGVVPALMNEPIMNLKCEWFKWLPNYPEDLNACAEMEKTLSKDDSIDYYTKYLPYMCKADLDGWMFKEPPKMEKTLSKDDSIDYYTKYLPFMCRADLDGWMFKELPKMVSATALQRCEAFLRVKGKWKE